jgi:hypothetical protein
MNLACLAWCLAVGALLTATPLFGGEQTVSFTRQGRDVISTASFGAGGEWAFAYDASFGQMTRIEGSGYTLSLSADPLLHLPLAQTIYDASGMVLLTAAIAYDAGGLRASRKLSAGPASSSTSYWYGGSLHPLVIERDGVTYRLIGKQVVERAGSTSMRTYAHADHLGSTRMVTDDQGAVTASLSYATDYGLTRIAGQSTAATDDSVASFYRFQGQEQDVFPLPKLGIEDNALAAWLDQLQLYHFPWRDYAAGLTAFTQTDPIPTQDSLYAAFAANPVNLTDETGGMWNELRYTPAHRQISLEMQALLDRLLQNPSSSFEFEEVVALNDLKLQIAVQRINRNNPFAPDGVLGKRRLDTYVGHVEVRDQRRREAEQAFRTLRREQDEWLATYSRPIGQLWGRMNARLGPSVVDEVDESRMGQRDAVPEIESNVSQIDHDNPDDEEDDSRMREDIGQGNARPPSAEDAGVEKVPEEEHRNTDKPCCHIL